MAGSGKRAASCVYGNAYMRRALAAQAQPGASLPEDLTTLLLAADSRGEAVDGSRRYHLRFASGQLPPAGAFWSLAAYDAQGLLAPNALNRQALGSRDLLRYNEDGSLDLVLGHEAPAPEQQSNWLPLPASGPARNCCCASTSLARRCWTDSDAATAAGGNAAGGHRRGGPGAGGTRDRPRPRDRGKRASGFRHDRHIVRPGDPAGQTGGPGQGQPQAQSQPGR